MRGHYSLTDISFISGSTSISHAKHGGQLSYFLCETLFKGLVFCWRMLRLRFGIGQPNTFPQNVSVHCVAALLSFWWNLRYLIWSTCCSVLPESMMRKILFFCHLFFCKLFAVTQQLFIVFCFSVFSSVFLVFHFFGDKHFFYTFVIFVIFPISPGRWEAVIFCL